MARVLQDRSRMAGEKQARKGKVFPFVPDVSMKCCRRKCCRFFTTADHPAAMEARKPLFDSELDREKLREELKRNWRWMLKLPGKRCCTKMALKIYSCSYSLIYGDKRPSKSTRSQAESNSARAVVAKSIATWFHKLKDTTDKMPDASWYQLNVPLRTMVWSMYNDAAREAIERDSLSDSRTSMTSCKSQSYFNEVWALNFPEMRLRKHCKFAKCDFCVDWRNKGSDWRHRGEAHHK